MMSRAPNDLAARRAHSAAHSVDTEILHSHSADTSIRPARIPHPAVIAPHPETAPVISADGPAHTSPYNSACSDTVWGFLPGSAHRDQHNHRVELLPAPPTRGLFHRVPCRR